MDYIGKICPFCRTEFKEDDDVVVCSLCEMPHHKDCWIENKACTTFGCTGTISGLDITFEDHCTNCNAVLEPGARFCKNCGKPSDIPAEHHYSVAGETPRITYPTAPPRPAAPPYGAPRPAAPPYGAPRPAAPPYGAPRPAAPPYGAPRPAAPPYGAPRPAAPPYGAPRPAAPPYGAPRPAAPSEKRFCMHCGTPLAPGQRFCPKCGKPIA